MNTVNRVLSGISLTVLEGANIYESQIAQESEKDIQVHEC